MSEERASQETAPHQDPELRFTGPLFVVGPPRSGTKLLRGILNASPEIGIGTESHLFPKLLKRFEGEELQSRKEEILRVIEHSHYLMKLKRDGFVLDPEFLFKEATSIADIVFKLLRSVVHWEEPNAKLIGDKTPNYIAQIPLLRAHFPEARFIAIFRDPRDQVLSISRTWGISILLGAEKWNREAGYLSDALAEDPERILPVRYEDLLNAPEKEVKRICDFLEVPFHERMLSPDSHEKHGEAKGMKGIKQANIGKYKERWSPSRIRRVEELSFPGLQQLGYPIHHAASARQLSQLTRSWLKFYNLVKILFFHIRAKGVFRGIGHYFRLRRDKLK